MKSFPALSFSSAFSSPARRPLLCWLVLAGALALTASPAHAHKGSDAYLDVQQVAALSPPPAAGTATGSPADGQAPGDLRLVLAVALRDLDLMVPIDADADARITWGEIKAATPQLLALLNATTGLAPDTGQAAQNGTPAPATPPPRSDACALAWQADGLERRSDGVYFRAVAQARCPAGQALRFHYTLLKDQDATHRLLVAGRIAGQDLLSTQARPGTPVQPAATGPPTGWRCCAPSRPSPSATPSRWCWPRSASPRPRPCGWSR